MNMKQIIVALQEMTKGQREVVEQLMGLGYEMEAANLHEVILFHEEEMKMVAVNPKGKIRCIRHV